MPTIFRQHQGRWIPRRLPNAAARTGEGVPLFDEPATPPSPATLLMFTGGAGRSARWVMLVRDGNHCLHNGLPVTAGLRLLAHRDSIAADGGPRMYFSTEEPASVETYAGADRLVCPRCRDVITTGQAVVRCPGCGVVHHETDERSCWTYANTCALCAQPTPLDAGLQWTPQSL